MNTKEDKYQNEEKDFFDKVEMPFEQTKDEVWNAMFADIVEKEPSKQDSKVISISNIKWMMAASVLLVLGLTAFLRLYTITEVTAYAETKPIELPDGSIVYLNSGSELAYHPYWWSFDRAVDFEGEAFFEVEKGSEFTVYSASGTTQVLGTSFNINSFIDYKVYCKTGKVKVSSIKYKDEQIITTGQMVQWNNGDKIFEEIEEENAMPWKSKQFNFNRVSLSEVFKEIERTYNVQIELNIAEELIYTGSSDIFEDPDNIIEIICLTNNLKYSKGENGYLIQNK